MTRLCAVVGVIALLGGTLASAQNVYRCGNSYGHQPCADGRAVDVSDPRSAAQKAQADAATQRNAQAADTMEKTRQREEALQRAHRPAPPPPKAAASAPAKHKTKKKAPEYFTAATPPAKPPKAGAAAPSAGAR